MRRPAEATTAAAGLAVLLAYVLGVRDPQLIAALTGVLSALPAVVTYLVDRGRAGRETARQSAQTKEGA